MAEVERGEQELIDRAKVSIVLSRLDDKIKLNLHQHLDQDEYEELPIGVFQAHFLGYLAAFAAAIRICEEYGVEEPEQVGFEDNS